MREGRNVFTAVRGLPVRLPRWIERLLRAGTQGYPPADRRGLIVANVTGYLASISSLIYAATYYAHDPINLRPLVLGNLLSAVCTALTPIFHRFGRAAAAVWISAVVFSTIFYFIAFLGRDSGIQLNYIGAAAMALAVLGTERIALAGFLALAALGCHLAAWYMFPPAAAINVEEGWFLDQLYANSAVSIMAIVFLVVFYGLRLARIAEAQTDALLHNMMPASIVQRLKDDPGQTIAESFDEATVLFADLKDFTDLSRALGPARIVGLLDELFSIIDQAALVSGMEKIKTIGDAYMAVAGVPHPRPDHADAAVRLASAMLEAVDEVARRQHLVLALRIGIATGPVMAGVIGQAKFSYDVWGDTVNLAARLEAFCAPGRVLVSAATVGALQKRRSLSPPQTIELKGIGIVTAFLLDEEPQTMPEKSFAPLSRSTSSDV
ncbi:MAG: adenylate/guanylate cyclase domain-containing protein [Parvibaculaceae bacterium]